MMLSPVVRGFNRLIASVLMRKTSPMELHIGETMDITHPIKARVKCVKASGISCVAETGELCALLLKGRRCEKYKAGLGSCMPCCRKDNTNVCFIKIRKGKVKLLFSH